MEMKVGLTYIHEPQKAGKDGEKIRAYEALERAFSRLLSELFTDIKIPGLGTLS